VIDSNTVLRTAQPKLIDKAPEIFFVDDLAALFNAATTRAPEVVPMLAIGAFAGHIFAGPTSYTEFTFTFTALSTSSPIQFNAAGFFFLDDISVTPTGVPDGGTTVSLLGCALLGLAAFRRKLSC
jgi:hypothetical protein